MDKVLELREAKEKDVMEEFALSQKDLIEERIIFSDLNNEYDNAKDNSFKKMDIYELIHQDLYMRSLEEKISNQMEIIQEKTEKLETIRLNLVDAQKERKIMEKLKEKDFVDYNNRANSIEQKELDEMAILRFREA